jgi:hypothetical protein
MASKDLLAPLERTVSMASKDLLAPLERTVSMASKDLLAPLERTVSMASKAPQDRREIGVLRDPIYEQEPATSQHCFSCPRAQGSTMQHFDASGTPLNCLLQDYGARRESKQCSVECLLGFDLQITRVCAQRIPISSRFL